MKKLGKKLSVVYDTVEAFSCLCLCSCYCVGGYSTTSKNNFSSSRSYLNTANGY